MFFFLPLLSTNYIERTVCRDCFTGRSVWLVWWTNEQNGSIHPSNSKRLNGGTRKLFSPANKWWSSSHHHSPSLLLSGIGIFKRSRIGSLPVGVEWTQVHLWMTVNEGNHLSSSLSPFRILQIPTKNGSLFGPPPVNNSTEVTLLCILKFWQSACVFAIVIRKSGVCRIFKIHCETYESWSIEDGKAKSRVIVLYFPGHLNHHRHTSSFVVL